MTTPSPLFLNAFLRAVLTPLNRSCMLGDASFPTPRADRSQMHANPSKRRRPDGKADVSSPALRLPPNKRSAARGSPKPPPRFPTRFKTRVVAWELEEARGRVACLTIASAAMVRVGNGSPLSLLSSSPTLLSEFWLGYARPDGPSASALRNAHVAASAEALEACRQAQVPELLFDMARTLRLSWKTVVGDLVTTLLSAKSYADAEERAVSRLLGDGISRELALEAFADRTCEIVQAVLERFDESYAHSQSFVRLVENAIVRRN